VFRERFRLACRDATRARGVLVGLLAEHHAERIVGDFERLSDGERVRVSRDANERTLDELLLEILERAEKLVGARVDRFLFDRDKADRYGLEDAGLN
jgi:hypothetical protein